MQIEDLSLNHQQLLEPKLKVLGSNISDFNFANLYIYRKTYQTKVIKTDKFFIKSIYHDNTSCIFPIESWSNISNRDISFMFEQANTIFPVDNKDIIYFSGNNFKKEFNRNDSDYLYEKTNFELFKGGHLSGQRNLSQHFIDFYDPSFKPLNCNNLHEALKVLKGWSKNNDKDFLENIEAFEHFEKLGLEGVIVFVDSKPVSYIFGSLLNEETFLVISIKGDTQFKGIYPYTYHILATQLPLYKFINLDQDLGLLNLRKAKLSYKPIELIKKWRIQTI